MASTLQDCAKNGGHSSFAGFCNDMSKYLHADAEGLLKLITQKGSAVDDEDRLNRTALHLACWSGNTKIVKLLISMA